MDWPSHSSERHLSFILRNILSLDEVVFDEERQARREEARQAQEKAKQDLGDILLQIEPVMIGCEAEDLKLPHRNIATMKEDVDFTDFDTGSKFEYMMVFKKLVLGEDVDEATAPEEAVCLIETTENPGHVKIYVQDKTKVDKMFHPFFKDKQGKLYLLGEDTVSTITKAMLSGNPKPDLAGDKNTPSSTSDLDTPENTKPDVGIDKDAFPPLLGIDTVDTAMVNKGEGDDLFAIPCPSWPSAAADFMTRRRVAHWPPEDVLDKIKSAGCHAVPIPHPESQDSPIEWCLSFNVAEKILAESLTQPQRRCFHIFQGLLDITLEPPAGLTSHVLTSNHFKTLLYWCLEDKPVETWGDDCLSPSLFYLLDKLIYCLIKRDIPNFFLPEDNMIKNVPRDSIDDILQKVISIRHDPIPFIRQMHDELQSPAWIPFDTVFAPLVCAIEDDPFYPGEECIRHSLMNLGFGLSALGEKRHALPYLARCVRTLTVGDGESSPVCSIDTGLTQMIHQTALEVDDLDTAIRYMMFLMEVIGDVPPEDAETVFDLPSILCNLGCLIHAKYHLETSSELKELLLAKAENFLLRSISSGQPSAYLEYANLLCRTKREHDAVFYLQKAASLSGPEALVQYGQMEKFNVDENMREQIEIYGHVTLPSGVYATHQLVMISHKRGLVSEAKEHLADLEKLVAQPPVKKVSLSEDMLEGIDEVDREAERGAEGQSADDIELELQDEVDGGKITKGPAGEDEGDPEDHERFIQANIKKSVSNIMSHAYKVVGMSGGDSVDGGDGVKGEGVEP